MRKRLLNNLLIPFAVAVAATAAVSAADRVPHFLVFRDGVDATAAVRSLEERGARVDQRVPPRIVVARLPGSMRGDLVAGVESSFTRAVPASLLAPLGPLAVAAGLRWNESLLAEAPRVGGLQAYGAVRALVEENNLPAPSGLVASPADGVIDVRWGAVPGAGLYRVQAARDAAFTDLVTETRSDRPEARLPAPFASEPATVHLRVRAMERRNALDAAEDLAGPWSSPTSLAMPAYSPSVTAPAPELSAPPDGYETEGFAIILEWSGGAGAYRVQAAERDDFAAPLIDAVTDAPEFAFPSSALHAGDRLVWRVRAWGAAPGTWSAPRALRIGEPRHGMVDVFVNPEAPR